MGKRNITRRINFNKIIIRFNVDYYTNIKIELLKEKTGEKVLEKIYDKNNNIDPKKIKLLLY